MTAYHAIHRLSQGLIAGTVIIGLASIILAPGTHTLAGTGLVLPYLFVLNLWARNRILERELTETQGANR